MIEQWFYYLIGIYDLNYVSKICIQPFFQKVVDQLEHRITVYLCVCSILLD